MTEIKLGPLRFRLPELTRASLGRAARAAWSIVALPFIAIVLALLVGAVVIIASQFLVPGRVIDLTLPIGAYVALFGGAFGSFDGIVRTLVSSTPLIFGGLSVALAFRAGLFNIGAQGQFLLGALGAVWIGVAVRDQPALVAIPAALLAAMLAGAAWGFIPGLLKAVSGAHEVVTTIMLNYTATSVIAWAVSGPLDQPGSASPITDTVGNAGLPIILGQSGHAGIAVALLTVVVVWWFLFRTTRGFEIRTVGANPDAARYAGMRPRFITVLTMSLAGALAGLSGAAVLLGVTRYMTSSFGTTVGFDSIAVALLGRSHPVGVVFAALLFGAMRSGALVMYGQTRIPAEIVDVLQATILFFLVAAPVIRRVLRLRGVQADLGTTETISRTYGAEAVTR
jgi:simple sugar transport system permease protein